MVTASNNQLAVAVATLDLAKTHTVYIPGIYIFITTSSRVSTVQMTRCSVQKKQLQAVSSGRNSSHWRVRSILWYVLSETCGAGETGSKGNSNSSIGASRASRGRYSGVVGAVCGASGR